MLNWLIQLLQPRQETRPAIRVPSPVRVSHDDKTIMLRDSVKDTTVVLSWADLASVTVMTNDRGPVEVDLLWILSDRDGRKTLTVPMGADGEHELLQAMQERLTGFDNMAVVEAMSSTEDAEFQIWPAAEPPG
jgi:hypothetical protein